MNPLLEKLKKICLGMLEYLELRRKEQVVVVPPPPPAVPKPQPVPVPPPAPVKEVLSFATPKQAWHAVRVMCDESGLTFTQKNIVCACIYQESRFFNRYANGSPVTGKNLKNGELLSTDWGIVQVNDYWWIGDGKLFPSTQYVLGHPEKAVQWMIDYMKINGHLMRWSSYSTGVYKQWLPLSSPMWKLAEK